MELMQNDVLYIWLMDGAPGSYYLVFLLPSGRNLIFLPSPFFFLYFFFVAFSAGLGNQPSMSGCAVDEG